MTGGGASHPMGIRSVPLATYRLQFNRDFAFGDAERVVPYLARLGISHIYASPYLKARAGSTHGYDIIDHNALNPEIGDADAFAAFSDALARHGMGQVLDFVPNHMGVGHADNAWWLDVLEWGEESPYAEYFDIDWQPAKPTLHGKVLVPFLGDHYGRVLEAGELRLGFDAAAGTFSVWYHDHRFPITPGDYPRILRPVLSEYGRLSERDDETVIALQDLIVGFRDLSDWSPALHRLHTGRRAEAAELKQLLRVVAQAPGMAEVIDIALDKLNGRPGDGDSLQWMHELLDAQHYRLAYWRVAAEEINYRRFFQINQLAGIRVEVPEVFEATHRLILQLIRDGRVHGLRIDHVDGLFDPRQYLERLQAAARAARDHPSGAEDAAESGNGAANGSAHGTGNGNGNGGGNGAPFWIVVEKILAAHERLREEWAVAGTTGYDFLNRVHRLFVDPDGEAALQRSYERFVGRTVSFEEIAYESKRQVMDFELASELRVLANEFDRLTESSWATRDYTLVGMRQALREVVASFPVYRTYVDGTGAAAPDHRDVDWAVAHARRRSLRADKSVFDFLQALLSTNLAASPGPYNRREVRRLAMKFQQYTGPVAAKGVEDTAFYRFNRLISLNEVGGEPARFALTAASFHKATQEAARRWPNTMLATATHDTKRGEDARVRIDALSEIPLEWGRRVRRWATLNQRRKTIVNDAPAPSPDDEYLFYQTLVGVWPTEFHGPDDIDPIALADLRERVSAYMIKAVREAKTQSSWINPQQDYEDALLSLVGRCLDVSRANPFLADFREFHRPVALAGVVNSLAQAVIKLTAPGVPDVYQGCELWDLSLVDPDNRRAVDFDRREAMLNRLAADFAGGSGNLTPDVVASGLLDRWHDGVVKLFVVWRLLWLRGLYPDLFEGGSYQPLDVTGPRADHVCAFGRVDETASVITVVPRLPLRLQATGAQWPCGPEVWQDTAIGVGTDDAAGPWKCVFTGRTPDAYAEADGSARLAASEALACFPVAVLTRQRG